MPLASGWLQAEIHTHLLDRGKTFFSHCSMMQPKTIGMPLKHDTCMIFVETGVSRLGCKTLHYVFFLFFFISMTGTSVYTHKYFVCHNKSRSSFLLFWHDLTFPCCCPKNCNNVWRMCDTALVCVCVCVCVWPLADCCLLYTFLSVPSCCLFQHPGISWKTEATGSRTQSYFSPGRLLLMRQTFSVTEIWIFTEAVWTCGFKSAVTKNRVIYSKAPDQAERHSFLLWAGGLKYLASLQLQYERITFIFKFLLGACYLLTAEWPRSVWLICSL